MNREEYLTWARNRALKHLPGDPLKALTSLIHDLMLHKETVGQAFLLMDNFFKVDWLSKEQVRQFINKTVDDLGGGLMNREQHLAWAKERALEYLPKNPPQAISSFMSDITKHQETASLTHHAMRILSGVNWNSAESVRAFIEGWR